MIDIPGDRIDPSELAKKLRAKLPRLKKMIE
jgi:hypothetical protein